jgi:hypothetical protein
MKLIPVKKEPEENQDFLRNPLCEDTLQMTVDFYKMVGFVPSWICYYAELDGQLAGCAGIKGPPIHGKNGNCLRNYGAFKKSRNRHSNLPGAR